MPAPPGSMGFRGRVFTGVSEGAMYVERYNRYFKEELGEVFYPGTLNIRTEDLIRLKNGAEIVPDEPELNEVNCYPVRINGELPGYVVVPTVKRHGPDVLELMAKENLREYFRLKDGDVIECELV